MLKILLVLPFVAPKCQQVQGASAQTDLEERLHVLEEVVRAQQAHIQTQNAELRSQRIAAQHDHEEILRLDRLASHEPRRLQAGDHAAALDHIWLLLCGALVMFMQAGFAMVEAGCCRSKNVQNILLKNLSDVCVGTLGWWSFGWAFAYGTVDDDADGYLDNGFIGTRQFFGALFIESDSNGNFTVLTSPLGWFFQWAFCSAAATIVSGGVAERVQFPGYMSYSFLMTAFIYPVVVAWTWGYGFLAKVTDAGYMDFAGSGIVHMSGGVGALVGAIIAGPREGRWERPEEFAPHSLPLIVLGTFILWFGWYGFNCGSTLGLSSAAKGTLAAQVAMNTTLAAATCGLVVFGFRCAIIRKYDVGGMCNGILAGLVSITAGCGNVEGRSAFAIGVIGALIYLGASTLLKVLRVDDPIDAFAVHGACGAWGVLAAALFDWGKGFDHVNGWSGWSCLRDPNDATKCLAGAWGGMFGANVLEVVMIIVWVGGLSAIIFFLLRLAGFLRASDETQEAGMDTTKHSPPKAYSIEQGENIRPAMTKVIPAN